MTASKTGVARGEASLATEALRLAGVQPGDRFLDVAAGPGALRLPAAHLGADVLATDWAPAMSEPFNLALPDDTFDVTCSQFDVMVVAERPRALSEMVRVTKPGGRVLLIAHGSPTEFEALQFFIGAVQAVTLDREGPPEGRPHLELQVSDPDVLRKQLTEAGLKGVVVDTSHEERIEVGSGRQLWDWCLATNPIPGMFIGDLTDEQRATVRQVLDGMLRERSNGNSPAVLTAPLNIGVGTKASHRR